MGSGGPGWEDAAFGVPGCGDMWCMSDGGRDCVGEAVVWGSCVGGVGEMFMFGGCIGG